MNTNARSIFHPRTGGLSGCWKWTPTVVVASLVIRVATSAVEIPAEVLHDKIRGGLLGQMLGNLNGLPHEMQYIAEPGSVAGYVPSLPDGAWTDDDTDFEWVYVIEMGRIRRRGRPQDLAEDAEVRQVYLGENFRLH